MSACLPLSVKSWFGTFDYLVDRSSQLSGQQNLLAVLIGKCWARTGEHRPYIIGTGFWKFPKCICCNNRVVSPMREESVSSWECLTALYTGPLWVTDSWTGSLLMGWLHIVSLYPLNGRFRYPCESRVTRWKPDVNSCWRKTLSDVERAAVPICLKAVETCSLILRTKGELSQLPGWSCQ